MNIYIHGVHDIPKDETCYIIAKSGIYLKKKLDLIESLTPVDKISFLEDIPTFAEMNISMIPKNYFINIIAFFKEVYKLYKSEAGVLLYYNRSKRSYKIHVPKQEASGASLSYKADDVFKDHILIGSIHSHGNMTAFHSSTDVGDELNFDGIHFTVGKITSEFFDLCGSIAVNGMRVPIEPERYITGIESREFTPYFTSMFRPAFEEIHGQKVYKTTVKSSIGYVIEGISEEDYKFNKKWLENVKEKKYTYQASVGSARYTFKDGKLIRLDDKDNNLFIKPDQFSYLDYDFSHYNRPDTCVCKGCIHRCEKLKLEDFSSVDEKDLKDEQEFYDNYFGLI